MRMRILFWALTFQPTLADKTNFTPLLSKKRQIE